MPLARPYGAGGTDSAALERDNLVLAEMTARELGRPEKEPIKFERAALRWLGRYVTEGKAVSPMPTTLSAWCSEPKEGRHVALPVHLLPSTAGSSAPRRGAADHCALFHVMIAAMGPGWPKREWS